MIKRTQNSSQFSYLLILPLIIFFLSDLSLCFADEDSKDADDFAKIYRSKSIIPNKIECSELGKKLEDKENELIENSKSQKDSLPEDEQSCSPTQLTKTTDTILKAVASLKDGLANVEDKVINELAIIFDKLKVHEQKEILMYFNESKKLHAQIHGKHCGLTLSELICLRAYTGAYYSVVNSALRSGKKEEAERYAGFVKILNSGLDKLADYKGYVRRGASLPVEVVEAYKKDSTISEKGYLSTSIDRPFSGSQVFLINSETCKFIGPLSGVVGENEVLCKPNTKFKVKNSVEVEESIVFGWTDVPQNNYPTYPAQTYGNPAMVAQGVYGGSVGGYSGISGTMVINQHGNPALMAAGMYNAAPVVQESGQSSPALFNNFKKKSLGIILDEVEEDR